MLPWKHQFFRTLSVTMCSLTFNNIFQRMHQDLSSNLSKVYGCGDKVAWWWEIMNKLLVLLCLRGWLCFSYQIVFIYTQKFSGFALPILSTILPRDKLASSCGGQLTTQDSINRDEGYLWFGILEFSYTCQSKPKTVQ